MNDRDSRHRIHTILRTSLIALLLLLLAPASVYAIGNNGVDELRGKWNLSLYFDESSTDFSLLIQEIAENVATDDENDYLAYGCMVTAETGAAMPLAVQAFDLFDGSYDVIMLSTVIPPNAPPFIIQFEGNVRFNGNGVTDDTASGISLTAFDPVPHDWSAVHHDRRRPHCPDVDVNLPGIFFDADVYADLNLEAGEVGHFGTLYGGSTNIVSAGMLLERPDGTTRIIGLARDDVFLLGLPPDVSAFDGHEETPPQTPGTYSFTLLDIFGNPIPGTTLTDAWTACQTDAPRNHSGVFDPGVGLHIYWDPAPPAPGFAPDPLAPLGFYQFELYEWPDHGGFIYGANLIQYVNHRIPWADFGGHAPGFPDGFDAGQSLEQIPDGDYKLDILAFSEVAEGNPGRGLECQVRDNAESLYLRKIGASVEFFRPEEPPPPGPGPFDADISAVLMFNSEGAVVHEAAQFFGYTEIPQATQMRIQGPLGEFTIPRSGDIFGFDLMQLPLAGDYLFTLLDEFGNEIPGAQLTDTWTGCLQGPPEGVAGLVDGSMNINVSWNPVSAVPDFFDPASGVGFYQIELYGETGGYFANGIMATSHLIPWAGFGGGEVPGTPDGFDHGPALSELAPGAYQINVISFSVAAAGRGLECQVRNVDQALDFTKTDTGVTIP